MTLTESQKVIALKLLEDCKQSGLTVINQGETLPYKVFDDKRTAAIGEIVQLVRDFLGGKIDLTNLKESSEILCRRHD